MAVIPYTIYKTANPLVWRVVWDGLDGTAPDTGTPFDVSSVPGAGGADRSVQITGTFGDNTVVLQGSNDGTNYVTLSDPQGNAISKTTASIEAVLEYTRMVRPAFTATGTGTSIVVTLMVRGSR